jgi:melibiose permease/lactose/raffinose/galactose permease
MEKTSKRNRFTYGLGTVGRDMVYTMISMYLMFYLTDVLNLDTKVLWWVTAIILGARIFDALNDPVMGVIVDNTHTKWGKYKPWILTGIIAAGILTILLFVDFGLEGTSYIVVFGVLYVLWGITYTMNDIAYWSMMPSLSKSQSEREIIGSVARICASVGLFVVVTLVVPITTALAEVVGNLQKAYLVFTIILVGIMWVFQSITLLGVKEDRSLNQKTEHTTLKELVKIIFKNDQLLVTAISMALFMVGYMTTTSFGIYYFKYVYGNEDMYSIFAVVLGVSQIVAMVSFSFLTKIMKRKTLYLIATIMVVAGYVIFFFAPNTTMLFIGIAGVLLFIGEAYIQLMMLMFLTDSVEYGEWKLGKRNGSVTLSIQAFINKFGGAIANGVVGAIVIVSGMKTAETAADMTSEGLMIFKIAMMILPLICIVIGFIIYRTKYILDEEMYTKIVEELDARKKTDAR